VGEVFNSIYSVVSQIPSGCVFTYGQVAKLAGHPRGARIVGYALRSIPDNLNLPAHRVVFSDGRLCRGEIFGGEGRQRRILMDEGITFLDDGRVDMAASGMKY